MSKIVPLSDRVLIQPIVVESKTSGGILLSGETSNNYLHGTVLAVGPGKQKASGDYLPVNVLVGDIVIYGNVGSTLEDMQEGVKVFLVEQAAIVAKVVE